MQTKKSDKHITKSHHANSATFKCYVCWVNCYGNVYHT